MLGADSITVSPNGLGSVTGNGPGPLGVAGGGALGDELPHPVSARPPATATAPPRKERRLTDIDAKWLIREANLSSLRRGGMAAGTIARGDHDGPMAWLITHTLEALNLVHIMQIYADKSKVKAQTSSGFPVDVAIDVTPAVARRIVRDIIDQVADGHSVEVVGEEVRPISTLR